MKSFGHSPLSIRHSLVIGVCSLVIATSASPASPDTYLVRDAADAARSYAISYPARELRVMFQPSTQLLSAVPPAATEEPILDAATATLPKLGGAAIWQDTLVCCLTRESALLIIDLRTRRITSRQSLPDFPTPRAAAYDPNGTLWMFSGNSLTEITFTSDGHFNPIHHEGTFDHPEHLAIAANGKFYIAENGAQPRFSVCAPTRTLLHTWPLPAGRHPQALVFTALEQEPSLWLDNGALFKAQP